MSKFYLIFFLIFGLAIPGNGQNMEMDIDKGNIARIFGLVSDGKAIRIPNRSELFSVKRNNLIDEDLQTMVPNLKSFYLLNAQGENVGDLIISPNVITYNLELANGQLISLSRKHKTGSYLYEEKTERNWTCLEEELKDQFESKRRSDIGPYSYGDDLQSFRLAIITTGEFYRAHGGTDELVLADISKTIAGVNRIFERNFALNFTVSGRVVLFDDENTDPFTPTENGGAIRTIQSSSAFRDNFDSDRYDLGITFNTLSSGWPGGGVATVRAACSPSSNLSGPFKGRIWAASDGVVSNGFTALVSHEIGHAFGARHTMNSDAEICVDAISDDNAYEIGSGNTLMTYGGKCGEGDDYVQAEEVINNYFHFSSLYLMSEYIKTLNCQNILTTKNTPPNLNINPCDINAFQIPLGTPFSISAEASDAEGDDLLYVWEQLDEDGPGTPNAGFLGPQASLSDRGPLFRGYAPSADPKREFPRFYNYFFEDPFETLSKVPRDLTLRCTVRDRNIEGGAFSSDEVRVEVLDVGPFNIEIDSFIDTIVGGETINLEWNDDGISNLCERVDVNLISLSDPSIVIPVASDLAFSELSMQYFVAPGFSIDGNFHFKVECHIEDCFSFYSYSRPFYSTTNCPAPEMYYSCGLVDITADIGADELDQEARAFTGMINYSRDFVVDATDERMAFVRNTLLGECEELLFPSGNPVITNFEFFNLQVEEGGKFTFKSPPPIAGIVIFEEDAFDIDNPCMSLVGGGLTESQNFPGTTTTTYNGDFDINLEACTNYRVGLTSFENDIMFSMSIEGDGLISIEEENELDGTFFYVVENEEQVIEAILNEADFRALRQGRKTVYTIKLDSEVFNPSDFVGLKLTDIGISGICIERSTNTTELLLINPFPDEDMDGYHTNEDCDDTNPFINPGADEIPNNTIDENCDGNIEGVDLDEDGFNAGFDCDDTNPAINPGAEEIPNNDVDEDCDGEALIIDVDMDGFNSDVDCDDTNPAINPGAVEIPNNDIDEDCDGEASIIDMDMDGFNSDEDCDDMNPAINPGTEEVANNDIDEDCDGEVLIIDMDMDGFNSDLDCDDANPLINPEAEEVPGNSIDENCDGIVLNFDADMDGFNSEDDCDDNDPLINPNAEEIPNNDVDENCDGELLIIDMDNDGFNSDIDCNDLDPLINPMAEEIPNNDIDENCDGAVIIIDEDMDGFNSSVDCDDSNPSINPGAEELPNNEIDENCDGIALIIDLDMDGYNSDEDCNDLDSLINPGAMEIPNNSIDENCNGELGFTDEDMDGFNASVDCNDLDSLIFPGAVEIPNNGIDEDCDGADLTSSNDKLQQVKIEVFPNPFQDVLMLDLESNFANVSIRNLSGQVIYFGAKKSGFLELETRSLPSGIYLVSIALEDGGIINRKLVKI